jgi:hypothetical protein
MKIKGLSARISDSISQDEGSRKTLFLEQNFFQHRHKRRAPISFTGSDRHRKSSPFSHLKNADQPRIQIVFPISEMPAFDCMATSI